MKTKLKFFLFTFVSMLYVSNAFASSFLDGFWQGNGYEMSKFMRLPCNDVSLKFENSKLSISGLCTDGESFTEFIVPSTLITKRELNQDEIQPQSDVLDLIIENVPAGHISSTTFFIKFSNFEVNLFLADDKKVVLTLRQSDDWSGTSTMTTALSKIDNSEEN